MDAVEVLQPFLIKVKAELGSVEIMFNGGFLCYLSHSDMLS